MPLSPRRSPTGRRRLTDAQLEAAKLAEQFNGLPEGVTHPDQLWRAFRDAVPHCGIPCHLFYPLEVLFSLTRPQDWSRGSRPVVWPSNEALMVAFDCSETRVREILNRLVEYRLIAFRDSPNGKRYGRRDASGRIVEACGLDLCLLAVRYNEFRAAAEAGRAEGAAHKDLKRRASIAKTGIFQILDTAREQGWDRPDAGCDLAGPAEAVETLIAEFDRVQTVEARTACVLALERHRQQAFEWLDGLLRSVNPEGQPAGSRGHYTSTDSCPDQRATVDARHACNPQGAEQPAFDASHSPSSDAQSGPSAASDPPPSAARTARFEPPAGITPAEAVALAPRLGRYLNGPPRGWGEVVDAARSHAFWDLNISPALWDTACRVMGPEKAAIALVIVSAKPNILKPGGYLHGMMAKAKAGKLNLTPTIFGLRKAQRAAPGVDGAATSAWRTPPGRSLSRKGGAYDDVRGSGL